MNTSFQRADMGKDEWLTPPEIIKELGPFDLDPCAPIIRPWDTAKNHYTITDNGLQKPWFGRVWCNPPYGNKIGQWMLKMSVHGNGIALIFARTDTDAFYKTVWERADGILFIRGRLRFYSVMGEQSKINAGCPSCLVAYGVDNAALLKFCGINGKYLKIT